MIQTTLHSTDFVDLEDMYADNFEEKKMRKKFRGKNWKKVTAILLAVCATMSSVPVSAAELLDEPISQQFGGGNDNQVQLLSDYPSYDEYQQGLQRNYCSKQIQVKIDVADIVATNASMVLETLDGKNATKWTDAVPQLTWTFDIAESGLYSFALEYYLDGQNAYVAKRNLLVDGQVLFEEANGMSFRKRYVEENQDRVNSYGDELRGDTVPINEWQTFQFIDTSGICEVPFEVYLEQGTHQVTLVYEEKDMYIGAFSIYAAQELKTYDEIQKEYKQNNYDVVTGENLSFEAEDEIAWTNDVTIRREHSSDVTVTPYHETTRYLNVYGGSRWDTGEQTIAWRITVPKSGLYKIGLRAMANMTDGLPAYRQIAIDGKVPFQEMLSYKFAYGSSYTTYELQQPDGEAYLFYLEAGEHTLDITVKQGEMSSVIASIEEDMLLLSEMQLEIKKLTGSEIDPNYDYLFFKNIPELKEQFKTLITSLEEKIQYVQECAEGNPSVASSMRSILAQMNDMVEEPFTIAKNYADLGNAQTTLGTWYTSLLVTGMQVDKIYVTSPEIEMENMRHSFLKMLWANICSLWVSFTRSYNSISGSIDESVEVTDEIDVWIARGTEWAQAIKDLSDKYFTPETGILVNIKTVPASQLNSGSANVLLLSITSGKQPDVALAVTQNSPVEFAIRDAVVDLSQFDDYEETVKRFYSESLVPYQYQGGTYALPETMDFHVLFYRKDIVAELGIAIPDTREELYSETLPALYNEGYSFYYPREDTQFILQHGGSYYTEDGLKSALDTPEAYQAMKEETELYTQYAIPVTANFYNRFRTGDMPMGIGTFTTYLQLLTAAPEISGMWGIAPMPGLEKEDGTIDRASSSFAALGDVILANTGKEKQSWEFLKWWSSVEAQEAFCREVEASLGPEARMNTANIEAFHSLAWKKEDLEVIQLMMEADREMPNVVGGYYTTRHLTNAWNKVVINGENLRDALEEAVLEINKELRMKQEEYGITND